MQVHKLLEDLTSLKFQDPHHTYRHVRGQEFLATITVISTAECRAGGAQQSLLHEQNVPGSIEISFAKKKNPCFPLRSLIENIL